MPLLPEGLMEEFLSKIFGSQEQGGSSPSEPPTEPDPYQDHATIGQMVLDHVNNADKLRWAFERLWFRSILYYLGNQWLTWDARSRRWREKKLRKWVPKPVTNRFASTVDSICAAIQSTRTEPAAWPATDDSDDIAAASVADRVIEIINTEVRVERLREGLAKWVTLNADAFAVPYYDKKDASLGFTKIPNVQCTACGYTAQPTEFSQACPQCGSPADPVESATSFTQFPIGRLTVDICSPLEVYLNLDITDISKQREVTIAKSYSIDTVKQKYPDLADRIQPDTHSATRTAQYFMDALAYSTEDSGYNLTGATTRQQVTVLRHIKMPSDKYPEGLESFSTMDGLVLEAGPSPYFYETQEGGKEWFIPLVKFGYQFVPGRLYSKTPAYDLIGKQDQLNRLESLMELASMKGVHNSWLLPAGSSISNIAGEPAQVIRWTPTGTGGAKPEIVTVAPFHQSLLELKTQYQEDFEELGGTFDALKGNVPKGVSAGYAIQLLTERSYGRFAPVFANWETSWTELYRMLLALFRTYATEPRLRKIRGATGGWEIQSFRGADLKSGVDVKIEGGSSRPRSKLAEQAMVESMAKIGIINPMDPDQRYEIAKMFGMTNVLGANDDEVRYAAGEWRALVEWDPPLDPLTGMPMLDPTSGSPFPVGGPEVSPIFDNHLVHIAEHKKPTRTDEYKQLPEWKKLFWQNHQLMHLLSLNPTSMGEQPQKPGAAKQGATHTASDGKPKGEAGSKANEVGDQTMNTVRQGGSTPMGGGGSNQYQ